MADNTETRLTKAEMSIESIKDDVTEIKNQCTEIKKVVYDHKSNTELNLQRHGIWIERHEENHKKSMKVLIGISLGVLSIIVERLMELVLR